MTNSYKICKNFSLVLNTSELMYLNFILIHSIDSVIFVKNNELKLGGLFFAKKLTSKDDQIDSNKKILGSKCPDKIGLKYDT